MNIILYSFIFILATLLIFFMIFLIIKKTYSSLSKKDIFSLRYSTRLLIFFIMIGLASFLSNFILQLSGLQSFSNPISVKTNLKATNEEIARVEKFLDNYEDLSVNDLQREISHLKIVFYNLKKEIDYYNSKIEDAANQYFQAQNRTDSLSQTLDSLKFTTQNQFNIILAERERRSDKKAMWAFYKGVVLSILTSLIAAYIFDKIKKKKAKA
jgi:septal ring factor EnvC (AmiA/AmiB activator)